MLAHANQMRKQVENIHELAQHLTLHWFPAINMAATSSVPFRSHSCFSVATSKNHFPIGLTLAGIRIYSSSYSCGSYARHIYVSSMLRGILSSCRSLWPQFWRQWKAGMGSSSWLPLSWPPCLIVMSFPDCLLCSFLAQHQGQKQ